MQLEEQAIIAFFVFSFFVFLLIKTILKEFKPFKIIEEKTTKKVMWELY